MLFILEFTIDPTPALFQTVYGASAVSSTEAVISTLQCCGSVTLLWATSFAGQDTSGNDETAETLQRLRPRAYIRDVHEVRR
ncbi:hypothetical protein PF010_g11676 [Phytophthora fragariae]|uniref:Uncharacterized protein n=1 Tax=Phytophthora fragariae TaxID=53985 RepID=A0A6A3U785_9STRA|nr:hypothetical protein PF010_g11676 [Phytophthora fragariae]KAE9146468.1 hypothetical protein PF006_g8752 [Phytophthora fragariae]KAE9187212.1 hypothetical protein PF004_g22869 [Phytophthora fragariae]KAE9289255.1 hypothetical protein PF001_g20130 [Phytophthora fragariae]KAE9334684.1 hypothetical protein PF008_g13840 [Phytophthora fragariae]